MSTQINQGNEGSDMGFLKDALNYFSLPKANVRPDEIDKKSFREIMENVSKPVIVRIPGKKPQPSGNQ